MSLADGILSASDAEQIDYWKSIAMAGGKAKDFKASEWWTWFDSNVLKAMDQEAINNLMNAKSEEDRMKAQMMFLAAEKPRRVLDALIKQGDGANAQLLEISTQNKEGENE